MATTQYPVFRRYSDFKTWFRIASPETFTELKQIGKYFSVSEFKAAIYPERMFIRDLVTCEVNTIETCSGEEFDAVLEKWKKELTQITI